MVDTKKLLKSTRSIIKVIDVDITDFETGQELLSAYNKVKSRASAAQVADALKLSGTELQFFEAALRDFAKRFDTIKNDKIERTTIISAFRLISWLETIQSRGVPLKIPDFSGSSVDENVGRKQVRALELILRSIVSERFGGDIESQLKKFINPELVDKWKASGDPDNLLSGTTFSELASLVVNKKEFIHYEKLYADNSYLNFLRDRRKTIQNFLDDVRRVRNLLAHNKSISDAQLQLLELYYEELTSPIQDAYDNGETDVDPSTYLDVSREELQSYFVDLKEDISSVQDEIADFRAAVEGDLGVLKDDTADIKATTASVKNRTMMIAVGIVALLFLVGGSYLVISVTQENTEAILVDTTTLKETTSEANKAISEVQETSQRIEGSIDNIQEGFAALSKLGGLIADPTTPAELYHNSRIYRQRGELDLALNSLKRLFEFDFFIADPIRDTVALLRQRYGDNGVISAIDQYIPVEKEILNSYAKLMVRAPQSKELAFWLNAEPFFLPAVPEIVRFSEDQDFNLTRYRLQTKLEQKFMDSSSRREDFYIDPVWADQSFETVKASYGKTDWTFFNNVEKSPLYFYANGHSNISYSTDEGRSYKKGSVKFWPVLLDPATDNNKMQLRFRAEGDYASMLGLYNSDVSEWNDYYSWNGNSINGNTMGVIGDFAVVEYFSQAFENGVTYPQVSDLPEDQKESFFCASWLYEGQIYCDVKWIDNEGVERMVTDLELCSDVNLPKHLVTFDKIKQEPHRSDQSLEVYTLKIADLIAVHIPFADNISIRDVKAVDANTGREYNLRFGSDGQVIVRPNDYALSMTCATLNFCQSMNDFDNGEWTVVSPLKAFKLKFTAYPSVMGSLSKDHERKMMRATMVYESNVIFR